MDNFSNVDFSVLKGEKTKTFQGEKPCPICSRIGGSTPPLTRRLPPKTKLRVHKKHRPLKSLCRRLEHASLGLPGQSFNGRGGGRKGNLGLFKGETNGEDAVDS